MTRERTELLDSSFPAGPCISSILALGTVMHRSILSSRGPEILPKYLLISQGVHRHLFLSG